MTFTSGFWYEIIYHGGLKVQFQFLDTNEAGQLRCRLCNGDLRTDLFRTTFQEVKVIGEKSPCI